MTLTEAIEAYVTARLEAWDWKKRHSRVVYSDAERWKAAAENLERAVNERDEVQTVRGEHEVTTSDGFTVLVNADGRILKVIAGPEQPKP